MKPNNYVTFQFAQGGGLGYGDAATSNMLETVKDIQEFTKQLREEGDFDSALIINIKAVKS